MRTWTKRYLAPAAALLLGLSLALVAWDLRERRESAEDAQFERSAIAADELVMHSLAQTLRQAQRAVQSLSAVPTSGPVAEGALWAAAGVDAALPYAYVGRADGSFLGVLRENEAALRASRPPGEGMSREWRKAASPGEAGAVVRSDQLDPRQRPWYIAAQTSKSGESVWLPPYVDARTAKLTITLARKAAGPEDAVWAADVLLSELQRVLLAARQQVDGVAYVVDGKGQLIASTVGPQTQQAQGAGPPSMLGAAQSPVQAIAQAQSKVAGLHAQALQSGQTLVAQAEVGGSAWRVAVQRVAFKDLPGVQALGWAVVTVMPTAQQDLALTAHELVLAALAALALALAISLWIASRSKAPSQGGAA